MPESENDISLLERLNAGDQEAFDRLYTTYRHWLLLSAMTILRSEAEAEELVQEFFIDLWQDQLYRRITIRNSSSLKNFLFVSIKNRCLNQLSRNETRRKRYNRILLPENYVLPDDRMENKELRNRLTAAMEQLPPRQAGVFRKAYLSLKTRKEIAAEMGISEETVKKQIALALKTLRDYLKKTEDL